MSMRWSMGSVRIRKRLAAISGGNYIGAERRAIGGVAALSRRSSLATQHRLSAIGCRWRPSAFRNLTYSSQPFMTVHFNASKRLSEGRTQAAQDGDRNAIQAESRLHTVRMQGCRLGKPWQTPTNLPPHPDNSVS